MAKKASAAQQKPVPATDAEALADIVDWSADRCAWQRQALRLLVQQGELNREQIDELYRLSLSGKAAASPITSSDVRSPKSATAVVTLKAVSNPLDVNMLASDQSLSFRQGGLTIVYGDNGAGKSGYARILKQACRARLEAKPLPILPNIYEQASGVPRAKIAYTVNGQNRQIDWQSDGAAPAELSAISVFDARTASVHVDGTNDVAYIPYSLELVQKLAKLAETLRERSKEQQAEIGRETPEALRVPPVGSRTEVALALGALNAKSDLKSFKKLATLSEEESSELADLRQDLGGDPAKTAKQMVDSGAGVLRFEDKLRELAELSGASSLQALRTLKKTADAAVAAANAAAKTSFKQEPISDVGTDAWRELWESARRFAAQALADMEFPPKNGPCPLCQQELGAEAAARLARFEAFITDDTRTRADAAEKAYASRLNELKAALMPASKILASLKFISERLSDEKAAEAARSVINIVWQLRRIVRLHGDPGFAASDVDVSDDRAELRRLADQLKERAAALSADTNSPERKKLTDRLAELEARSWLEGMLPDIENEIGRKKTLATLARIDTETETRPITQKASQLAEALVTDALRAQFTKEVGALGVSELAVELRKESAQSGAARFRVRLVRKPGTAVGLVLSEGEHRCVALAGFLAELATSGSKSAIIFDDPVSSLDHRHRDDVATRLAVEAQHRQVIVLTHDIAFLMLLNRAAQEQQVDVAYRCVSKGADRSGYCDNELPFNARPVDSVLDAIEADINNKRILFEKGKQAEWRKSVRSSLEQLRETWERAVEEFIGPVFKRLSAKVDSKNLHKLTVLELTDCDAMRRGYGECSELLHSIGESLNPKLPSPDEIIGEVVKLRDWHNNLRARQSKLKSG